MNAHTVIEKLDQSVWKVIENFEHKCEEMDRKGTVFEIDKFIVRIKVPYIAEYDIHFQKREDGTNK
jgi:hypothetical protein